MVGAGPLADEVAATAPANVTVLGHVSDASLRWLYRESAGLVAASYEDFGLTPVEAAMFGRPTAALRLGGFLDTTVDGSTGVFFDEPDPRLIAAAVDRLCRDRLGPGGHHGPRPSVLDRAVPRAHGCAHRGGAKPAVAAGTGGWG